MKVNRIAIVGFGSAGAVSAIELKRLGFHVEIFEQAERIAPVGAGILLNPSGQIVLEKLTLLSGIRSQAERIEGILVRNSAGRTLVDARYDWSVPGRISYGVERTLLFSLFEAAVYENRVPLHLGKQVNHISGTGDQSRCVFTNGEESDRFDLILVTDGARSRLRPQLMSRQYIWNYSHSAYWTIGHCSSAQGKLLQFVEGSSRLVGVLPTGGGRASFFWGVSPKDQFRDFAQWRNEALRICPPAEPLLQSLDSFDQLIPARYQHVFSFRPMRENVVLLGDAWHAMSPHFGQGTNLAMLDGYIFAKLLSEFEGDLERTKSEFLRRRRPNNRIYAALSFGLSPFFQSDGIMKGLLRDTFLPLLPKIPWMKKQMAATISGLKPGLLGTHDLEV